MPRPCLPACLLLHVKGTDHPRLDVVRSSVNLGYTPLRHGCGDTFAMSKLAHAAPYAALHFGNARIYLIISLASTSGGVSVAALGRVRDRFDNNRAQRSIGEQCKPSGSHADVAAGLAGPILERHHVEKLIGEQDLQARTAT
jgi:hypothetical protein